MTIPASFLQELLARTDLVELVGRYVPLRKGGANYLGLCPFHAEKSPSFTVSPSKQFYHCFGCGAHGNAIDFLMRHLGLPFPDAVRDLAQQAGMSVPQDETTPAQRAQAAALRQRRATLTEVLAQAARAYQAQLKLSPRAIAYLKGRGLTGAIAKTYGLGYAPAGWRFLSTIFADYQDDRLVEAGLVIAADAAHAGATARLPDAEAAPHACSPADATADTGEPASSTPGERVASGANRRHDRFRDRIMFPIRNVKGECIGFGGRVIDGGEPKYLNSPETPVFRKGEELYGLFEARAAIRQQGYVLVTEGYMDVVALAQLGFGNAVATLGTACTPEHVRKLFRFSDAVVFAFDGDAAGRRAARRALEAALPHATDTRTIRFLFLPSEHDPDSFIRTHGAAAFAAAVQAALPLSRYLLDVAATDCDLDTSEGRARLSAQAQPLWTAMPDSALKRQLLHELADRIGLEARELQELWHQRLGRGTRAGTPSTARTVPPAAVAARAATAVTARQPPPPTPLPAGSAGTARPAPPGRTRPADGAISGPAWASVVRRARRGLLDRADRIARIVLGTPEAWLWLTAEDHALLATEPPPHGLLFSWLERQWLEHGAQPWAALREAMRGEPFEALALALHDSAVSLEPASDDGALPPSVDDQRHELRELLRRLRIERLKQEERALIERATHDPEALRRYRVVMEERLRMQNGDEVL
ncbi:DNA primase [Tepidimonas charontis]|uniref:DNA primase n=1 Tax=Tepidimonas charontis TaxID=2267262 RepID=A0A554X143_9BURK|nr:CHC2 zinc finger domain-containing protein [Tepidimonas charontis]TSE29550.1 DNA primase [Tepidimonas charontis]